MSMKPLVSVCCITYNHEKYIRNAIEGFLMQKTDFPIEIIIHDDCSTDDTAKIIRGYQQKYPQLINSILQTENQYSIKGFEFERGLFKKARGQYIALCEGDDYWTDPEKLKNQVDFLESHSDYTICFHWAYWLDQPSGKISNELYGPPIIKPYYTIDDLLEYNNFLPTCSVMFRNDIIRDYPEWCYKTTFNDMAMHMIHAQYGKIGFIDQPMAIYRFHSSGMCSGSTRLTNLLKSIDLYELLSVHLGLFKRLSYHTGISRLYVDLCVAYKDDRKFGKALLTAGKAVKIAPIALKVMIFLRLVYSTLVPMILRRWRAKIRRKDSAVYKSVKLIH